MKRNVNAWQIFQTNMDRESKGHDMTGIAICWVDMFV